MKIFYEANSPICKTGLLQHNIDIISYLQCFIQYFDQNNGLHL